MIRAEGQDTGGDSFRQRAEMVATWVLGKGFLLSLQHQENTTSKSGTGLNGEEHTGVDLEVWEFMGSWGWHLIPILSWPGKLPELL